MLNFLIEMTERGLMPDPIVRLGVRRLCGQRLRDLRQDLGGNPEALRQYAQMLRQSPVAFDSSTENRRDDEVPAAFFDLVLGPHRKQSCAYWSDDCFSLYEAEKQALQITMERAQLRPGMKILELGCGWGSLTLAMAQKLRHSRVTAISNCPAHKAFIDAEIKRRGLLNVEVLIRDVADLESLGPGRDNFDRVVSVEMFEHLRNYEALMRRIHRWLAPDGKLFVHVFSHRQYPYVLGSPGDNDWMGRYFFTGGQMPSHRLLGDFQQDLKLEQQWHWDGRHYQKTSEAWLLNMQDHRREILRLFQDVYGPGEAQRRYNRWRVFFLSMSELFGYRRGTEWGVSQYLFETGPVGCGR